MKVKFIGTGDIYVKERSACTLVDNRILIDCGNGIVKTLLEQNVDVIKIHTLLITHLHGDHFFDIPFLMKLRKFNHVNNKIDIYCPKGTEGTICKLTDIAYPNSDWKILKDKAKVNFIEFEELNNKEIAEGYFVNSYEANHGGFTPAYGYVLKKDKSVGFSGDSTYCNNIDIIIENSDLSVLDMTFIKSDKEHMGINDIEMLSRKYSNKTIATTHMSEAVKQCVKEKKISNLITPNDGDEIII